MIRYLLLGFLVYFAFRFIVELLIPIFKTTRQVKKQFDAVREQQQYHQQHQQKAASKEEFRKKPSVNKEDYLDFEEIK